MLDLPTSEVTSDTASRLPNFSDEASQANFSILRELDDVPFSPTMFQGSLTGCCCPIGDPPNQRGEILTSPMESPSEDLPLTPGPRSDGCSEDIPDPLISDGNNFGDPFDDAPLAGDPGRRTPSLDETDPSPENDPFSSLCSEYLAMLDNPTSKITRDPASLPPCSSNDEAARAILSILYAGEPTDVLVFAHGVSRVIDRLLPSYR